MTPIKFLTSKGYVHGMLLDEEADLVALKEYPAYIKGNEVIMNIPSFAIDEDETWTPGFIIPDIKGEAILHALEFNYHRLRADKGWVKMELGDPHYGEAEWPLIVLNSRMEVLEAAVHSTTIQVTAGFIAEQMTVKLLKHLEAKNDTP